MIHDFEDLEPDTAALPFRWAADLVAALIAPPPVRSSGGGWFLKKKPRGNAFQRRWLELREGHLAYFASKGASNGESISHL